MFMPVLHHPPLSQRLELIHIVMVSLKLTLSLIRVVVNTVLMLTISLLLGIFGGGILSGLGSLILLMMIAMSRNPSGKDDGMRFLYLNGLALCTGLSTGPLIETVWDIDPSIVISALLYACVIFTCFTVSALVAPDGKYLALGGPLLSILSTMLLASILNIFFRSPTFVYVS